MKKFSLLMALILLVTVGGVYATWNYAQGSVSTAQGFALPKMETVVTTGTKGNITVDTSGFTMKIDDLDDANIHKAALVMSGEIVITFTPAEGADADVETHGIPMRAEITCTEDWEYGTPAAPLFTINTAANANIFETTGSQKTLTITAAQLENVITLGDFVLDTYAEFQNFQTILNRGNIKISVSEVTTGA